MIIKALVENTSVKEGLGYEHGLSFYVETVKHKLLFDMGRKDLFIKNAIKMGVEISNIDAACISHGHYDHGGGLNTFLVHNTKAPVYISEEAFGEYYALNGKSEKRYIGLNAKLKQHNRLKLTGAYMKIDEELELFADIHGNELRSHFNDVLMAQTPSGLVKDNFQHEQNLIINQGGKTVLFAGCAHKGIVNIVNKFYELKGGFPDYVVGGFHLFNPSTGETETTEFVEKTGEFMLKTGAIYYTCHCTGLAAFVKLKEIMGDKIKYIATGDTLEI